MLDLLKKHKKKAVTFALALAMYLAALGLGADVSLDSLLNADLSALGSAIEGE